MKSVETDLPFMAFSHEADIDYVLARKIFFIGAAFSSRFGFSAHQACEKYMKAFLVQQTGQYFETHKLLDLRKECISEDASFGEPEIEDDLRKFDAFDQVGRYGPFAKHDPLVEKNASGILKGLSYSDESYLQRLDRFVYFTRGKLDWTGHETLDALRAILENNRKNFLVSTWTEKQPIVVVLTKRNKYFKRNFSKKA